MKLIQAVSVSQGYRAYRVVGAQRIFVEVGMQKLRVLIQCRSKRRWMIPDQGGIWYLNGVRRERDGFWSIASGDLAALKRVAACLPVAYQYLLTPDSDDWQPLEKVSPAMCREALSKQTVTEEDAE